MKHDQRETVRPAATSPMTSPFHEGTPDSRPRPGAVAVLAAGTNRVALDPRPGQVATAAGSFAAFVLALFLATPSRADTIVVRPDGTGDQPTIQAAVDAATPGDVVELTDGVFQGAGNRDVDFRGKAISVQAQSGDPANCRIDCEGSAADPHRAFLFVTGETSATVLRDLGIENGHPPVEEDGGAVLVSGAAPTLAGCVFQNCAATDRRGGAVAILGGSPTLEDCAFIACASRQGGAIAIEMGSPAFTECRFFDNRSDFDGGAIYGLASASRFSACHFARNSSTFGGALFFDNESAPQFESSLFHDNSSELVGGAICLSDGNATITGCTFSDNAAFSWDFEGGAAFWCSFDSEVTADNSIFAFGGFGRSIACEKGGAATLTCCDVFGNEGGDWVGAIEGQDAVRGNLSADPFFCDRPNRVYTVAGNSPCLPAGNECGTQIGAFGEGCDPVAVIDSSWGSIKARFGSK